MKILKKGEGAKPLWWVGAKLECQTCGQVGELEEVDANRTAFNQTGPFLVTFSCLCCGDVMELRRLLKAT